MDVKKKYHRDHNYLNFNVTLGGCFVGINTTPTRGFFSTKI